MGSPEWMREAACRGMPPDLFFPWPGQNALVAAAKVVCSTCPVRRECLAYATAPGKYERSGVWGGTAERERRPMRRGRSA